MPLLVVINPVCGDRSAKSFFDEAVLPYLEKESKTIDKLVITENKTHAGSAVLEFLESTEGKTTIILGSGDGTLHEIINTLSAAEPIGMRAAAGPSVLNFALVPCGTANAMYASLFPPEPTLDPVAYKLKSVQAFVANANTTPLSLGITTLSPPPSAKKKPRVAISAVVTSTALHAAILHDSEALRLEHPGIERFKVAAQNNITKWYNSYVKLLPVPSVGVVQIYDPSKKEFVDHEDSHQDDPIVDVDGPFAYFLSTVNVDRLEPSFCITPLHSAIPPTTASCDIVMVRPLRDPSLNWDSEEARLVFVQKATAVLQGAYKQGSHVDMRYGKDGEVELEGVGPTVVEYIRCGGWDWIPNDVDDAAHLLCADGAIFHIEEGGKAACRAAKPNADAGFGVYI